MALFFLMCSERSGSNFITKQLNGHSNICGPSPRHILNPVARNLFRYGDLLCEKNWNELLCDIKNLMGANFSIWKKEFSLADLKSLAAPGDVKHLLENIFLEEARVNGKQHVFIKENHIYEFIPFLLEYFPEAKYVYLVRDPRDMALSWKKNPDHRGGVVAAARQWKLDQQQNLKNHWFLKERNGSYMVKYEDLTANNKAEIKKIIGFLGLPFEEGVFEYQNDVITKKNAEKQRSWSNLAKGVISNNSKKYLEELQSDDIKVIEKICWYEMKHLGYEAEFKKEEVDLVTSADVDALHEKECEVTLTQSEGVKGNIQAKAKFYQR